MTSYDEENVAEYNEENTASKDVGHALKPRPTTEAADRDPLIPGSGPRRYFHLDATRIAAVICVAVDHGSPQFGQWNVIFTQNWVLQLLFVVSGTSFAMSKQSLSGYIGRLFFYFCLGVLINFTAWNLANLDWRHSMFAVVFQFWFVVHNAAIHRFGADDPDFIFELPTAVAVNSEAAAEPAAEPAAEAESATGAEAGEARQDSYEPLFKALAILALALAGVTALVLLVVKPVCQAFSGASRFQDVRVSDAFTGGNCAVLGHAVESFSGTADNWIILLIYAVLAVFGLHHPSLSETVSSHQPCRLACLGQHLYAPCALPSQSG